jgi:hypothetical protein
LIWETPASESVCWADAVRKAAPSSQHGKPRLSMPGWCSSPPNRHDEQEITVLCLRILQAALVYIYINAGRPGRGRLGRAASVTVF